MSDPRPRGGSTRRFGRTTLVRKVGGRPAGPLTLWSAPPEPGGRELLRAETASVESERNRLLDDLVAALRSAGAVPDKTEESRVSYALLEALTNAMEHGNRRDPAKKIRVELRAEADRWSCRIEDEGAGFDPAALPCCTEGEGLQSERGRGVHSMRSLMDEVVYYGRGNGVILIRKFGPKKSRGRPEA